MTRDELRDAAKDAIIDVELGRRDLLDGVTAIMALTAPRWVPVTPETPVPQDDPLVRVLVWDDFLDGLAEDGGGWDIRPVMAGRMVALRAHYWCRLPSLPAPPKGVHK